MARFLSAEWFAEIDRSTTAGSAAPAASRALPHLVLEQVVQDTPEGEVRYRVVVGDGTARIERAAPHANGATAAPDATVPDLATPPDLTIISDWATAAALAQGHLSAQAALMAGRLHIRGSLARLSTWTAGLAGLDPVPPDVRRRTTY
jgi:hypothetical protein